MNALAGPRRSAEAMPTKVTLPRITRATLASAGVSFLQGGQVDDQKFSTIGLPVSEARLTMPAPRRLGSRTAGAGRCIGKKPSPVGGRWSWPAADVVPRCDAIHAIAPSVPAESAPAATRMSAVATIRRLAGGRPALAFTTLPP